MGSKVDIIHKEFIKPISPTPNHLRSCDFTILDQTNAPIHVPIILYYPLISTQDQQVVTNSSKLLQLKKSLSQILDHYYPFAGRINDSYTSIICNDDGVPFFEAFAHSYSLDEILGQPNSNIKLYQHFLPYEESVISPTIPVLVQATVFKCGGMTVGLCASHKFTDASTLNTLIKSWVAAARFGAEATFPEFVTTAKFMPTVDTIPLPYQLFEEFGKRLTNDNQLVTKIFVFDASCIEDIKAKAVSDAVPMPTRNEAVSALIWKCALAASTKPSSLLVRSVNLRKRLVLDHPLPNECMGNAIAMVKSICKNINDKDKMDLPSLVKVLRDGIFEFRDEYENKCRGKDAIFGMINDLAEIMTQVVTDDDLEHYGFNTWCHLQFSDADFGWGKPSWVSGIEIPIKNFVFFKDTIRGGGGFEVWITLSKAHMEIFEQQLQLIIGDMKLL